MDAIPEPTDDPINLKLTNFFDVVCAVQHAFIEGEKPCELKHIDGEGDPDRDEENDNKEQESS
jgi:hypothetical protein